MELKISTTSREMVIDITSQVEKIVSDSPVKNGFCNIFAKHSTCAIIINENYDPNIGSDLLKALDTAIPRHASYKHDIQDNNAHAHIKSAIIGPSETIQIKDKKLVLGSWQGIMLCEFDGPRERTINVEIIGK